jgi:predicted nucleotide-binding protein
MSEMVTPPEQSVEPRKVAEDNVPQQATASALLPQAAFVLSTEDRFIRAWLTEVYRRRIYRSIQRSSCFAREPQAYCEHPERDMPDIELPDWSGRAQ